MKRHANPTLFDVTLDDGTIVRPLVSAGFARGYVRSWNRNRIAGEPRVRAVAVRVRRLPSGRGKGVPHARSR